MPTQPTPEHEWLKQLLGEWTYISECPTGEGGEVIRAEGKETVRMLGDLWIVGDSIGDMPGSGTMTAIMTLGYDPGQGKFVGTWVGSPMASMFIYEGSLDAERRALTLDTTGQHYEDPTKQAEYQDIVTLTPEGGRELRSRVKGDDGAWAEIMKAVYTRVS